MRASALAAATGSCRQAGGSGCSSSRNRLLRHQPAASIESRVTHKRCSLREAGAGSHDATPGPDAAAVCASAATERASTAAAAAGSAAQPLPSRLQREVDALVGLDVEYTHLHLQPGWSLLLPQLPFVSWLLRDDGCWVGCIQRCLLGPPAACVPTSMFFHVHCHPCRWTPHQPAG